MKFVPCKGYLVIEDLDSEGVLEETSYVLARVVRSNAGPSDGHTLVIVSAYAGPTVIEDGKTLRIVHEKTVHAVVEE